MSETLAFVVTSTAV